jgi:hypothetical protein
MVAVEGADLERDRLARGKVVTFSQAGRTPLPEYRNAGHRLSYFCRMTPRRFNLRHYPRRASLADPRSISNSSAVNCTAALLAKEPGAGGVLARLVDRRPVITIAADPKHLGARIGITSVLHTGAQRSPTIRTST